MHNRPDRHDCQAQPHCRPCSGEAQTWRSSLRSCPSCRLPWWSLSQSPSQCCTYRLPRQAKGIGGGNSMRRRKIARRRVGMWRWRFVGDSVALVVSFDVLILVWVDVSLLVVVVTMLLPQRELTLQEGCDLAEAANLFLFCCRYHCYPSSHHALDDVVVGGGHHLFFSYGPWLQGGRGK